MSTQITNLDKANLVFNMAIRLLKPQNKITTLEIKMQLIKDYPIIEWKQQFVHEAMDAFYRQGLFIIADDNGTYRTYSDPNYNHITVDAEIVPFDALPVYTKSIDNTTTNASISTNDKQASPKASSVTKSAIDKNKALELMKNNRGHYFTAFIKENGTVEVLNCQFVKAKQDLNAPNSVVVKLRKKAIESYKKFELENLAELSINKENFVVTATN